MANSLTERRGRQYHPGRLLEEQRQRGWARYYLAEWRTTPGGQRGLAPHPNVADQLMRFGQACCSGTGTTARPTTGWVSTRVRASSGVVVLDQHTLQVERRRRGRHPLPGSTTPPSAWASSSRSTSSASGSPAARLLDHPRNRVFKDSRSYQSKEIPDAGRLLPEYGSRSASGQARDMSTGRDHRPPLSTTLMTRGPGPPRRRTNAVRSRQQCPMKGIARISSERYINLRPVVDTSSRKGLMRAVAQIAQSVEQGIENPHDSSIPQLWIAHPTRLRFQCEAFCYASLVNLWQGCSPSSGLIIPPPAPLLHLTTDSKVRLPPEMTPASYKQHVPPANSTLYRLCREPNPGYRRGAASRTVMEDTVDPMALIELCAESC